MGELLDKPNMPIRIATFYAYWSAGTIFMYLMLRFIWPGHERVGKMDFIGIATGVAIGALWSLVTLIRAFLLARKGIFVESRNRLRSYNWKLFWIIVEIAIPFTVGYCALLIVKANKPNLNFTDAVWSLILFVLFTYFFVSSIGYYSLERRFGRKFFDRTE